MKTRMRLMAGLALGVVMWGGTALGEGPSTDCDKRVKKEKVEGQVVKVDLEQGRLTVRETDGTTHEFQASRETLQDYKAGDHIKAKLRPAQNCP
ncbi:MAG: hypothetical protein FIA90_09440 [candidate division NC10 bacterium]|nr:hypothetical protein [Candidatus Methylomirabilis sp.]NJD68851.1 hypothetical protein [candidate division NC10 bacterium]